VLSDLSRRSTSILEFTEVVCFHCLVFVVFSYLSGFSSLDLLYIDWELSDFEGFLLVYL